MSEIEESYAFMHFCYTPLSVTNTLFCRLEIHTFNVYAAFISTYKNLPLQSFRHVPHPAVIVIYHR